MYDRYKSFRKTDGTMSIVPFIKIPIRDSDTYIAYEIGKTRLDILSYKYYGDSNYGWLIMQANPDYNFYEFEIPNGASLRIPLPLQTVLKKYEEDINSYKILYGIE